MLHSPALLVLDEPSTGVDPVSRVELWRLIAEAAAGGAAVIVSTSYLDEAERASRLVALDEGRVLVEGSYDDIRLRFGGVVTESDEPVRPEWSWRRGRSRRELWPDADPPTGARDRRAGPRRHRHRVVARAASRGSRMNGPLARAASVTRRFGAVTAVDGVSLEVRPGEVVGLLGANGAGKTTLIRMFLGLLTPSEGHVEVLGGTPDRERRRRLGYVPQNLGLYRDLTVSENLRFVAGSYGSGVAGLGHELRGSAMCS